MTIGIYKLVFNNTNKVYIGQSVNIEKRFSQHLLNMKNSTATDKLTKAVHTYGIPSLEILEECSIPELDLLEEEIISIYDSVNNGFNTYSRVYQAPILKGTEAGNSKYSRGIILKAINYLRDTKSSISTTSKVFGIHTDTLRNIVNARQHHWVSEQYPELLEEVRNLLKVSTKQTRINIPKTKYTVNGKGIRYPKVLSPDGVVYEVSNINEFARVHSLSQKVLFIGYCLGR